MGLALSFFGGMAERGSELIAEERESQKQFITESLKQAARERKAKEEEYKKRRDETLAAYESIQTVYGNAGLSEEQKTALLLQPSLLEVALKKAGDPSFNIVEAIKVSPTFKLKEGQTAQQFVQEKYTVPSATGTAEVPEAFKTGILTRNDDRTARTVAGALGYKLEDLMPEAMPSAVPEIGPVASIDREALFAPRDFDQRINLAESKVADAVTKFGKESKEATQAVGELSGLIAMKNVFNPKQMKFADMIDQAKIAVATADSPEKQAAAEQELQRLLSIGAKGEDGEELLTYPQMVNTFRAAVGTAIQSKYPQLKKDEVVATTDPQTGITDYRYVGSDPTILAQIEQTKLAAVRSVYKYFSDANGVPRDDKVKIALTSMGVQFNEAGQPLFDVTIPEPPAPQANATKVGAGGKVEGTAQQGQGANASRVGAGGSVAPTGGLGSPRSPDAASQSGGGADHQSRASTDIEQIQSQLARLEANKNKMSPKAYASAKNDLFAVLQAANRAAASQGMPTSTFKDTPESLRNDIAFINKEIDEIKKRSGTVSPEAVKEQLRLVTNELNEKQRRLAQLTGGQAAAPTKSPAKFLGFE